MEQVFQPTFAFAAPPKETSCSVRPLGPSAKVDSGLSLPALGRAGTFALYPTPLEGEEGSHSILEPEIGACWILLYLGL